VTEPHLHVNNLPKLLPDIQVEWLRVESVTITPRGYPVIYH